MYICCDCKKTFEEPKKGRCYLAECWGRNVYDDYEECPFCGGAFEEAVECLNCGEHFLKEDLTDGYCDNCIDRYASDFNICYTMAKITDEYEDVKINGAISNILGDDVNEILADYIKKNCLVEEIKEYYKQDESWFAEHLEKTLEYISEKENKNERN